MAIGKSNRGLATIAGGHCSPSQEEWDKMYIAIALGNFSNPRTKTSGIYVTSFLRRYDTQGAKVHFEALPPRDRTVFRECLCKQGFVLTKAVDEEGADIPT